MSTSVSSDSSNARAREDIRRAIQLHTDRHVEAAIAAYRDILKRHPQAVACWSNLGAALRTAGRKDEGLQVLLEGERLCPGVVDLSYNLGNALTDAGDHEGALQRYQAILSRDPHHLKAAIAGGKALMLLQRFEEAVDHYRSALESHPDNALFYNALGWALWNLRRMEAAAAAYRRAIAIDPAPAYHHTNLHLALSALGCYAEDERRLRDLAARDADSPKVLAALGQALLNQGHLDEGLQYCDAAVALDPDNLDARLGRARANFLAGRYAAAWPDYRWRRRHRTWRAPEVTGPEWEGQDLGGKTILLYGEQGLGDVIQFARYASPVAQRGARVILYCPSRLARLLQRLADVSEIVPVDPDRPCPRTDWVCSLLDLPGVLQVEPHSAPGSCPYLPTRTRPRPLLPPTRAFRIGIVWAGNANNERDRLRSCRLDDFAPLIELPDTEFISFQAGPRAGELQKSGWQGLIRDAGKKLVPFEMMADALAEVDLVITVDTAMAHLAGALGRRVWTLLAFAPDWRWQLGRIDTPWYPTMRLFRQPAPNDWARRVPRGPTRAGRPRSRLEGPTSRPVTGGQSAARCRDRLTTRSAPAASQTALRVRVPQTGTGTPVRYQRCRRAAMRAATA